MFDSRRQAQIIFRHAKPVDDDLARKVFDKLADPVVFRSWGDSLDEAFEKASQRRLKFDDKLPMTFPIRHPSHDRNAPIRGATDLNVNLRAPSKYRTSDLRRQDVPLFERERDRWVIMGADWKSLGHENSFEMQWFLGQARKLFPVLEPEFACADLDFRIAKNVGDDPTLVAWSVTVYGPALVEKFGRDHLLAAPVWNVEELEDGTIWLQVTENPFTAAKEDVRAFAKYLGLAAPR